MNLMYYVLEANCFMIAFYVIYKLFLQKITWYQFNRLYLIAAAWISFLMPLVNLGGLIQKPFNVIQSSSTLAEQAGYSYLLLSIYIFGVLFMLIRLFLRIGSFFQLIKTGQIIKKNGYVLVLIPDLRYAFSFWKYLCLDTAHSNSKVIFDHELAHIQQGHTWDNLFFELIGCISWFNPIILHIREELKVTHEFIADEIATSHEMKGSEYAHFLIKYTHLIPADHLGSNMFNQSSLKRRIMKLDQKRSPNWMKLKYLLLFVMVPVFLVIMAFVYAKDYGIFNPVKTKVIVEQEAKKEKTLVMDNELPPPPPEPPVTKAPPPPLPESPVTIAPPPPPAPPAKKIDKVKRQ